MDISHKGIVKTIDLKFSVGVKTIITVLLASFVYFCYRLIREDIYHDV